MKDKIAKLKVLHATAKTKAELSVIDRDMKALAESDPEAFGNAMIELARESADYVETLNLRERFRDVAPIISLAYVAKTYFGKSREWLYQRINGYMVNGRAARFNDSELQTMRDALLDIENKLSSLRASL